MTISPGVSELQIHRGQLENILNRAVLDRMLRMCHYDFSGKNSFFRCAVESVEIRMILRAIMMLNAGSQESLLFSLPRLYETLYGFRFHELRRSVRLQSCCAFLATRLTRKYSDGMRLKTEKSTSRSASAT